MGGPRDADLAEYGAAVSRELSEPKRLEEPPRARPVWQCVHDRMEALPFITLALSAGEDPGWVAEVCGTSEQMIFRHYRKWMPSGRRADGAGVARALGRRLGHQTGTRKERQA